MKKSLAVVLMAGLASLFPINAGLFASETDDRIESAAKESYVFKTYLKGDDIKIESKDGIVTLTGTVAEEFHKSLAAETVTNLPGVNGVEENLVLKGELPALHSDPWMVARIKSTLLFHRNVNASETEVFAKDGIITLKGVATSQAQKDLTAEYAKDVEGVKDVKNEMTVLTAEKKPGEKTMGEKLDDMAVWMDDASITGMVKTTLLYHRSTSGLKTNVETKEGVVTLSGKAKNAAEIDLAGKFVSDVHGVKDVVNNLAVEKIAAKAK